MIELKQEHIDELRKINPEVFEEIREVFRIKMALKVAEERISIGEYNGAMECFSFLWGLTKGRVKNK